MPRFLAPITVAQEYVTTNETISGSETILGATSGKDSYWTTISVQSGLSANYGSFVHNVSAVAYYGDGTHLTGVNDVNKLPLSGGTLTGKLYGNDANFSNSLYATTITAVDFYGNGSQLTNVAKLNSPAFVGTPTAPTAPANTNSTQLATTQFVIENGGDRYLTTSSTSLTLNNNNGVSLTASAGLSYITTQDISIVHSSTQYMLATVVSYNKSTGVMVFDSNSHTGAGTFNTWTINVGGVPAAGSLISSNNLSDVISPSAALINLGGFSSSGGTLAGGLTGTHAQFNSVTFTPNAVNLPYELGKVWYDTNKDALCYYNSVSSNKLHIGQEIQQYVRNATANTILKGDVVRIIGFTDQSPDVVLTQANTLSGSIITGVANQDIPANSNGYIVTIGEVANFDTSRFSSGEDLFLSPLSAGKITNVLPANPYFAVQVGVCMYSHATNGKLLVYTQYLGTAANTVVGTLDITQLPTIPISAGGTGQTNAAAGLSALGGFPISGGTITDGLTASSGTFLNYLSSTSISGIHYGDGSNLTNIANSTNIQVYTTAGTFTWNKPTNAKSVNITLIGAGGGGASGRKSLSGTAAFGGGGGGGGAFTSRTVDASLLSSSEIVVVGAAGTGGASISANSTNGLSGSNGGDSKFGTWLFAQGGGGAAAPTTTSDGAGSSASTRGMFPGGNGGAGTTTNGSAAGSSATAAAGGGGGAGLSAVPAAAFGGNGGTAVSSFITGGTSSGGGLNGNGVAGSSVPTNYPMPGSGGSGGGSSTTTNAGSGGTGGNYGGGGGGGAAALDNIGNSGAGGPGANGIVVVTTYF